MWSNSQQRLQPQATGWQQPMMTGYPGQQHQQQQQQQHQMPSMPVPMAQRPMQTGYLQQQQQQQPPSHHLLMPQNTGYPGLQQQQQQQPMLGSFSAVPSSFLSTFMPSNPNASWGPAGGGNGVPQLQQQQHHQQQQYQQQQQPAVAPPPSLPQYFQQHNQQTMGQSQVQVQWSLTADERRNYDKIFRAWDSGSGYIDGSRATDVFKESGLEREDLMKIWALSDRENRGKLNLAEFHVAMGLIYRRLSGNPIPDVLPAEMVPPSSKDLDSSVDFLKDLLRKDTNSRSTNLNQSQSDDQSNRYAKIRSFANGASPEPSSAARKDATVYRHNDGDVKTYKSTSRHLDRRNVRFQGEEESSDFDDLKKQLSTSQDLLERSYKAEDDDEDLKAEIDDLKYRIKRVQEDIEFNKSGRRTEGKDNERRRLERELLFLMHEKLPELEDKKREADRRKRSEDRAAARKRDGRNSRSQSSRKYSRKGDSDSSSESNEEDERGYLRGSYGSTGRPPRAASPEHRRSDRKSDTDSHRGANGSERVLSPIPPETSAHTEHARHSSPAPPPPSFAKNDGDAAGSRSSPAASRSSEQSQQSKPPATAEERQAYIRAEAQRRVQERMRMLTGQAAPANGTSAQPSPSTYDSSLQARLEQDKAEAARKAEQEDAVLADRERQRQIKLEEERLRNNTKEKANIAEATKALQQVSIEVTASEMHHAGDDGVAAAAARAEIAAEEKALQAKASIATADANASQERLRELKKPSNPQTKKQPPQPPTSRVTKAPPKPPPPRSKQQVSSIPPEPSRPIDKSSDGVSQEALSSQSPTIYHSATLPSSVSSLVSPPASGPTAAAHKSPSGTTPTKPASTNPFHRLGANSASPALPAAVKGSSNPFFRPPTGASTTAETTATKSPLLQPQAVKPPAPKEDDWGDMHPHQSGNSDDSDDEDGAGAKEKRAGLAGLLFGGTGQSAPSSRPGSAKPPSPSATAKSANTVLPALGAAAGSPPPRAALLGAIQSGARLRKASTNDRSSALGAGTVVDAEPEIEGRQHENRISDAVVTKDSALNTPERSQPEANELASQTSTADKRQSVDWYGGLAADSVNKQAADTTIERLESLNEDAEEDGERVEGIAAQSDEHTSVPGGETLSGDSEDPEAEFDISISKRVRSLYSYEGQRPQDANFSSNQVIVVHPPKDSTSDWLFGQVLSTGSRGWMPKTYVEDLVHDDPATVLYEFDGSSEDELKVSPGMKVEICERLNSDWARVILDGRVGLMPLSYLEEGQ